MTTPTHVRKHAMPCPHPDCGALLFLAPDAPAGVYDCICKAVRVTLEWRAPAPYVQPQPYLSLESSDDWAPHHPLCECDECISEKEQAP